MLALRFWLLGLSGVLLSLFLVFLIGGSFGPLLLTFRLRDVFGRGAA